MEECLDNEIKSTTEGQSEIEVHKKFVDDQGNNLLEEGLEGISQNVENLDNHKMTDSGNTDSFYDAEDMPATQENAGNEISTEDDEDDCCYSDIEPIDVSKRKGGHREDSSIDLVEKPESWNAGNVQAMEVCEAVNSIYGKADYVCVDLEDLVDGCAVATLCQIQGHTDAVVCSSLSEGLAEERGNSEEDEEYEGDFHGVSGTVEATGDDSGEEESDGRCLASPTLREISEEEDTDGMTESESPVLSRSVCLTQADSDTVEDAEEFLTAHKSDETAAAAATDADIEPNDVDADGAMIDTHNDIEAIDVELNVDAINFHQDAGIVDCPSDSTMETFDDHHHAACTDSHPHFDHASETTSFHDLDMSLAFEVASAKAPCSDSSAAKSRWSGDSTGVLSEDLPPPHKVIEHTAAKPPAVIKDAPRCDSFKEPKEQVVLRSKKSKRVDSIRKSFIKLGSFGHSNGNEKKTKSKKEKDKAKNEVHEVYTKQSSADHELATLHGQQGGQATGQGAVCGPSHCDHVQKQNSFEGQPQSPVVTSPTGPQKRISNPLAVDAEKLQEFSNQKHTTMQMMYHQALNELEQRKCEYAKSPTELNRTQLEGQGKLVKRLRGQIGAIPASSCPITTELEIGKLQDYSVAEQQKMYRHAVREFEKRKSEHTKSPNDFNRVQVEGQAKVVHCLAVQIGMKSPFSRPTGSLSSESEISSLLSSCDSRSSGLDTSLDSACFMEEKRDSLAGLPPPAHPSTTSFNPRHKKNESLGGTSRLEATKKESSILRSHSDSFKRSRNEPEENLRQGNSSDDLSKYKMLAARQTVRKRLPDDGGKSQGDHSENSSDSAIDQISPTSERPCLTRGSSSNSSLHKHREIIAIDDQEFTSDEENFDTKGGPFSDFNQLIVRPAHLAVLLHYLISNSDPSPLLFYMITETYPQGSGKELRKWAYEIFSTFLVEKAPLKINIDDAQVDSINRILVNKHDKEELMKVLFAQARQSTPATIADLMADFRSKQALGLGSIYGDHELKDTLDHAEECKVIERALWSHFERFVHDEDNERSAAMAAALAFFFKQHGYTNVKNNILLERCPTFNSKDKTKFGMFSKPSRKAIFAKGHHLLPQQYYTMTYCQHCQNVLCGVGNQGFLCQKCDLSFHKSCSNNLQELCYGKKMRPAVAVDKPKPPPSKPPPSKPPPSTVFGKIISRKPSSAASSAAAVVAKETQRIPEESSLASNPFIKLDALHEREHARDLPSSVAQSNKSDQPKSIDDTKSSPTHSRSRSPEDGAPSDEQSTMFVYSDPVVAEHSSKPSSFRGPENGFASSDTSISASSVVCDSDFETEPDLPSLDSVIPKDQLKKMKPKEKKRQEVINELFYTERAHVRNLKVMQRLFCHPMRNEQPADFVNLLFPNIDEMVEVHGGLNKDFVQKRKDSENSIVGDLASILVKHFSGEMGDRFKQVCARFCEKQSQALEVLKTRQRKDPKLASLLQDAASNPLCRRLELKDFLPTAMQRLTKYPLLIENLLKYTQPDSEEHGLLQLAYSSSKEILNSVNKAVREYENRLKLSEIQKKLDKRQLDSSQLNLADYKNLDLNQYTLLYDGSLTWRLSRDRLINVHVVLLSDILLLLQKQDEKLVLRCQSSLIVPGKTDTRTTHSPIIKLNNLLVKSVATDKCAFFLVNISEQGPQIYDLVAGSKDEKNKWYKQIMDAVEISRKATNPIKTTVCSTKSVPNLPVDSSKVAVVSNEVVTQVHEDHASTNEVAAAEEEETVISSQEDVGQEAIEHNHDVDIIHMRSASFSENLEFLRQTDDSICRLLFHKLDVVSHFSQLHEEDLHVLPDWCKEPPETKDPVRIVGSMITMSSELQQQISGSLSIDETAVNASPDVPHSLDIIPDSEVAFDQLPPPVPPRSPRLCVPPLPPRLYRAPVKISSAQLTNFCVSMSKHLVNLLEAVTAAEGEKKRLEEELHLAHHQLGLSFAMNDALITGQPISDDSCTAFTDDAESREQFEDCHNFGDENCAHASSSGEGDFLPRLVPIPEVHVLSDAIDPCDDDALSSRDIDLETNVDFDQETETTLRNSDSDSNAELQDNCVLEKNDEDFIGEDVGELVDDSHHVEHEHIPSRDLATTDAQSRLSDDSEDTSATF